MNILQLVTRRQRRGAEVFAAELSQGLARRGHAVHFAGLAAPPAEDALVPEGVHSVDVGAASGKAKLSPVLVWRLARYLRAEAPDVVQANGSYTLKYAVLARWLAGRQPGSRGGALVYRNIGVASDWLRWGTAHRLWMRWLVRSSDYAVSVSAESRADLHATCGLAPSRTGVVHRGVPTEPVYERAEARQHLCTLGLPAPERPAVLHVGGFTPEKNHAWLVDTFAEVRAEMPESAPAPHLFLVGDGPERVAVEERVAQSGQREHVHLLGVRSDVSRLMAGADLLVLPSLTEGLPGVILEAGAQGTPTVANDVGGVTAAVHGGKAGLLVDEGDRAAFVGAVARLLQDDEARRALGEAAQRHVRERFSIARSTDDFEQLFRRIASSVP